MRTETQKAEPWAFEGEVFESTEELVQKSLKPHLVRNDQMSHATEEENAGEGITEYTITQQASRQCRTTQVSSVQQTEADACMYLSFTAQKTSTECVICLCGCPM